MKSILSLAIIFLLVSGCRPNEAETSEKTTHPSHKYTLSDRTEASLGYLESDYVPVYSDIYERDGTKRFMLTTTISIRNTSLSDSAYILHARYFDSYGKPLKDYIDSTILLSPLESVEFVVEEVENLGGAGANFIIEWGADRWADQILIQSVMIGTFAGQGVSFLSGAKVISSSR